MTARHARIEIYRDKGVRRRWRYRVIGGNGERMSASQSYRDAADAKRGALDLFHAMQDASYYRVGGIEVREVTR